MNQQILRRTFYCISVPDMVLSFVLPLYCVGLGFSPLETTGLFSVVSLALLVSKFFIGGLCDKVGRKRVFCAGAALQATSYAVLAFSQSAAPLYLSQILNGLSISLLSVALYAMLSDDRKQNFAAQQGKISGSGGQGQLLGVLIYWGMTAFMKFRMSWRYFLLVSAALCAYGAVTAGRNLQETKPIEQPAKVQISGVLKKLFCKRAAVAGNQRGGRDSGALLESGVFPEPWNHGDSAAGARRAVGVCHAGHWKSGGKARGAESVLRGSGGSRSIPVRHGEVAFPVRFCGMLDAVQRV